MFLLTALPFFLKMRLYSRNDLEKRWLREMTDKSTQAKHYKYNKLCVYTYTYTSMKSAMKMKIKL